MSKFLRLLTISVLLSASLLTGCGVAEQSVSKTGRVLAHGERKLERHL